MNIHSHTLHATKGRTKSPAKSGKTRRPSVPASTARHEDASHMAETQVAAREAARHAEISRDAYYRAERRGFEPGYELADWLAAEAAMDATETLASIDDPGGTLASHYQPINEI